MANRRPVRVCVLDVYEYCGRQMITAQALQGRPFFETNAWFHTWCNDQRTTPSVFLQDMTLVY
jgi:hypothetical protein